VGAEEASAVDLGEMKKGSSVAGIDKVAEALESDTDLGAKPASSVEFDELLDDLSDSDEHKAAGVVDSEGSTEMDAGVIDEPKGKKKDKKDKKKKDKAAAKA